MHFLLACNSPTSLNAFDIGKQKCFIRVILISSKPYYVLVQCIRAGQNDIKIDSWTKNCPVCCRIFLIDFDWFYIFSTTEIILIWPSLLLHTCKAKSATLHCTYKSLGKKHTWKQECESIHILSHGVYRHPNFSASLFWACVWTGILGHFSQTVHQILCSTLIEANGI